MLQGFAVGRIGKDAELRSTNDGKPVSNFSLAVEVGWGERKKTLWIACTLWGKQAESLTQYLTKGKTVAIMGELNVGAWISRQDSDAKAEIQVTVSEVTLCGSAPSGDSNKNPSAKAAKA